MRLISQPKMDRWEPYVFFKEHFTPEECATIIHLAKGLPPAKARVGSNVVDKEIRSSDVAWMKQTKQTKWIYDKLESVCYDIVKGWYPFKLSGFEEMIQVTRYFATEGGHYDWHQDFGGGAMSTRKLSMVLPLNAGYTGGEFEMFNIPGEDKTLKQATMGNVIAFPSWEPHRVLKVTEGERWSLVCWVHGPPYS